MPEAGKGFALLPVRGDCPGPPPFDSPVAPGGYRWWYLDALDRAGERGVVVIAFVGSVFSPYYYHARRRGRDEPGAFCALNVALYRRRGKAWSMTERRSESVSRGAGRFLVGPSEVRWDGSEWVIDVRERCMPFGGSLRGQIRARPAFQSGLEVALDAAGRHRWTPWAPRASVSVEFDAPRESWQGEGYLDSNCGSEPLEEGFHSWSWSRVGDGDGVRVHYDLDHRGSGRRAMALRFGPDGFGEIPVGGSFDLRRSGWLVPRPAHGAGRPRLRRTFEDTPFYARSLISLEGAGQPSLGMHESLSLRRFRKTWVRMLLPFRMPREWRTRQAPGGPASSSSGSGSWPGS